MHRCYADILSRIEEPPLWFDEFAVPRFDPFTPHLVANIYADEAALVRIECQGCETSFNVAFTGVAASKPLPSDTALDGNVPLIRDHVRAQTLHYGDPPNIGCCASGASMNSMPRQVLQYWVKPYAIGVGMGCNLKPKMGNVILDNDAMEFQRAPEFEISLKLPWMD